MAKGPRVIRLFLVGSRIADRERAELIVDRLAARRPVADGAGEWLVTYGTAGTSEAMRSCEADLTAIDPGWIEILDFAAVSSRGLAALGLARAPH